MKFAFRLQSVLRVRRWAENGRTQTLARARKEMTDAEAALDAETQHLADARRSLAVAGRNGTRGADIQQLAAAIDAHATSVDAARRHLAEEAARVETARAELVEASRDRQALERLEERQRSAAAKVAERAAGRTLDEVASVYHRWHTSPSS